MPVARIPTTGEGDYRGWGNQYRFPRPDRRETDPVRNTERTRDMTASPKGCGVIEHEETCLCDVNIDNVKPWKVAVTIPYDYFGGIEICEKFNLGVPWTGADLATFFEQLSNLRKHIDKNGKVNSYPNAGPRQRKIKKLTLEQLEDLKSWIREGIQPTPCTRLMQDTYGVSITRSYVTKMRQRMEVRGEL